MNSWISLRGSDRLSSISGMQATAHWEWKESLSRGATPWLGGDLVSLEKEHILSSINLHVHTSSLTSQNRTSITEMPP